MVLGPERLPKAARFAGLWVRRARAQWYSVKNELERELAAEDLKRSLHDAQAAMRDLETDMRSTGDDARREFEAMRAQTLDALDPQPMRSEPDASSEDAPPTAVTPTDDRDGDAPAQLTHDDQGPPSGSHHRGRRARWPATLTAAAPTPACSTI